MITSSRNDSVLCLLANDCDKAIVLPDYLRDNECLAARIRLQRKDALNVYKVFNFEYVRLDLSYAALRLLTDDYTIDHILYGGVEAVVFLESIYDESVASLLRKIAIKTLDQIDNIDDLIHLLRVDCKSLDGYQLRIVSDLDCAQSHKT